MGGKILISFVQLLIKTRNKCYHEKELKYFLKMPIRFIIEKKDNG